MYMLFISDIIILFLFFFGYALIREAVVFQRSVIFIFFWQEVKYK